MVTKVIELEETKVNPPSAVITPGRIWDRLAELLNQVEKNLLDYLQAGPRQEVLSQRSFLIGELGLLPAALGKATEVAKLAEFEAAASEVARLGPEIATAREKQIRLAARLEHDKRIATIQTHRVATGKQFIAQTEELTAARRELGRLQGRRDGLNDKARSYGAMLSDPATWQAAAARAGQKAQREMAAQIQEHGL